MLPLLPCSAKVIVSPPLPPIPGLGESDATHLHFAVYPPDSITAGDATAAEAAARLSTMFGAFASCELPPIGAGQGDDSRDAVDMRLGQFKAPAAGRASWGEMHCRDGDQRCCAGPPPRVPRPWTLCQCLYCICIRPTYHTRLPYEGPPGPRLRVWARGAGADPTRVGAADDPCGGTYRHFPGEKGKRDDAWEWTAPASAGLGCIAASHFLFILLFVSHVYTANISCLHLYYCSSALHRIH